MIYLDNAASTSPAPELREFMADNCARYFANPSAGHHAALACRRALDGAAGELLAALGAKSGGQRVIWNSGGTEGNNFAIFGADLKAGDEVVYSTIDHPSVQEPLRLLATRGVQLRAILPDSQGAIPLDSLAAVLSPATALVITTAVHNESGAVADLPAWRRLISERAPKARWHVDFVQGLGKVPCSWDLCRPDSLTIGGHKFHGPHSSGALICRRDLKWTPQLLGGAQQEGLRSGTLDAATAMNLARAAAVAEKERPAALERVRGLRRQLQDGLALLVDGKGRPIVPVYHGGEAASPFIVMFSLPGSEGAILARALGSEDIAIGTGSACSAETKSPNKTLTAMGVPRDLAFAALRVSFSRYSTADEVASFLVSLQKVLKSY